MRLTRWLSNLIGSLADLLQFRLYNLPYLVILRSLRTICIVSNDLGWRPTAIGHLKEGEMPVHSSPAVERALAATAMWADRLGHPSASSLHLCLALLDDEEGRVAQSITQAGLDIGTTRDGLRLLDPAEISHSVQSIMGIARLICREIAGENNCRTEHVLMAILESEPAIRNCLETAGLRGEAIRQALLSAAGPPLTLDEPLDLSEPNHLLDTARILDASANRAREALRVIEDYCRFLLNDAMLCRETKELRHSLAEALACARGVPLLQARDTPGDVGTGISTVSEQHRTSPLDVVHASFKRLQESLRSLEEFGKVINPEIGRLIEQVRYRSYTLERAMAIGASARVRLGDARLYLLVTAATSATSVDFLIEEAASGGVEIVQLREKNLTDSELLERARRVRRLTRKAGMIFIVNDRPDIARLSEADGVHLGQEDMPVREARRIVGSDALVGVSTHSIEQVRRAVLHGADYLGVGPLFSSKTKQFPELAGLDFVRQVSAETSLPAFALGGITLENLPEVLAAGACRVAVSAAICSADDPRPVAAAFSRTLRTAGRRPGMT